MAWPPPFPGTPAAPTPRLFAFIQANGTIAYQNGAWITSVTHTPGTETYVLNIAPAFQNVFNQAIASIRESSPNMIGCIGDQFSVTVNCYNASGAGAERDFTVELLTPST